MKIDPLVKQQAHEAWLAGESYKTISEETGVKEGTISYWAAAWKASGETRKVLSFSDPEADAAVEPEEPEEPEPEEEPVEEPAEEQPHQWAEVDEIIEGCEVMVSTIKAEKDKLQEQLDEAQHKIRLFQHLVRKILKDNEVALAVLDTFS